MFSTERSTGGLPNIPEDLLNNVRDDVVIARMGVPPSTKTIRERLKLAIHPSSHPYSETQVTLGQWKEVDRRSQQGEKLSERDEEILLAGVLSLVLSAISGISRRGGTESR